MGQDWRIDDLLEIFGVEIKTCELVRQAGKAHPTHPRMKKRGIRKEKESRCCLLLQLYCPPFKGWNYRSVKE